MAKTGNGYLGGFQGRLGPAVGYLWNGKWCMRSLPSQVRNPRSAKQMEHRAMFRQEVQLAARMRWAVNAGLTAVAREEGMTAYNLFVSINQQAFSLVDEELRVDYAALALSAGTVAPVALGSPALDADYTLTVDFEKNPLHMRSNGIDKVYLYIYCPENQMGYLALPVYRRSESIAVVLPTFFHGREVHLYAFVQDEQGRCSSTAYGGTLTVTATAPQSPQTVDNMSVTIDVAPVRKSRTRVRVPSTADEAPAPPVDDNPLQLSLW